MRREKVDEITMNYMHLQARIQGVGRVVGLPLLHMIFGRRQDPELLKYYVSPAQFKNVKVMFPNDLTQRGGGEVWAVSPGNVQSQFLYRFLKSLVIKKSQKIA